VCGILGFITTQPDKLPFEKFYGVLKQLFILSESRGQEASGLAVQCADRISILRAPHSARHLVKSKAFKEVAKLNLADAARGGGPCAALGQARLVTNGVQGIETNNQPVIVDKVVLVHNGIVLNVETVWEGINEFPRKTDLDSEVIAAALARFLKEAELPAAARAVFSSIRGESNIAALFADRNALLLATNSGSLYVGRATGAFCFASERETVLEVINDSGKDIFSAAEITHIKPNSGLAVDLATLECASFSLNPQKSAPEAPFVSLMLATQRRIESRLTREEEARASMRRCTRCLLPESMPFISFDEQGVCNYCRHYTPAVCHGQDALEQALARCRSDGREVDCLLAFSGGRDSSYGLHLLKREYGMTPLAYTYDWGMVTDIGRRNQARMCGALGVEHLWISADIKLQRSHIRRNVNAWMRRPDLGIIPLFMAGDKLFFRLANETMKRKKIPLVVFCSNKLEKTDFKIGFCGISPQTEANQPFSLNLKRKLAMLAYYGKQFLLNPAYINRSIANTLACYVSYYFQEGNYLYLYDYLPWEEQAVNATLRGEYDWETALDSPNTWRIGDATVPFYNYIYYTVAGFTEYDTFRSNQIREGHIDRETALALVREENQPRWEALREYLRMINVDLDSFVRIVEAMPRLYKQGG